MNNISKINGPKRMASLPNGAFSAPFILTKANLPAFIKSCRNFNGNFVFHNGLKQLALTETRSSNAFLLHSDLAEKCFGPASNHPLIGGGLTYKIDSKTNEAVFTFFDFGGNMGRASKEEMEIVAGHIVALLKDCSFSPQWGKVPTRSHLTSDRTILFVKFVAPIHAQNEDSVT